MNRNDIEKAIKHYKSLQKRYTTLHDGKNCEITKTAIEALQMAMLKTLNSTDVIKCHIFVDSGTKEVQIPQELLIELINGITENGSEFVRFKDKTISTNGIVIVGKHFEGNILIWGK